ncbi:MAG TPA: TRAM domain-containing protein, partial [Pseudogracilibacillus sp.]|nr:TRAM domain-containing protein [Pseudogracilibacillus sp.]
SEFESDVLEVIPEEKSSKEGKLVGYSDNYMKVEFEGTPDMIGSIIRVKITEPGYPINKGVFVKVEDRISV